MYNERDIKFSKNGDIVLKDGDFDITKGTESLEQDVYNRAKTNNPDWYLHDGIGADLEDLRGEPNTREVGERGASSLFSALTYGDRINAYDVKVRPVPTKANEITLYTFINTGESKPLMMPFKVNLE